LVDVFPPRRRASGRVISRFGGGTSSVALAGRTWGPVRYSYARPDRRALRVDAGGRETGPNFHGARCGGRRCRSSDQARLDHFVVMGPLPKKFWVGGLAPSRWGNLPSRARLGPVADRNPGVVEVDGIDALREDLLSTPAKGSEIQAVLRIARLTGGILPGGGKKRERKLKISARTAVRDLLTLSFLPKTVIVPVYETESTYP
jgi:hypothetical protein